MKVKQALESGKLLLVECRDGDIVVFEEQRYTWPNWVVGGKVDLREIGANVIFCTTSDSVMGSFLLFHDLPGAIGGENGGSYCRHYAKVNPDTQGVIKYGTRGYHPAHGQTSNIKKMSVQEFLDLNVRVP